MEIFYTILAIIIILIVGYLIGTISFARIISKKKGVDITKVGSKNPGGTNVGRSVGRKEGIEVMIIDIFKSFIPCLILKLILFFSNFNFIEYRCIDELLLGLLGLSICLGHAYPIFYKFQGGKCVACVAGYVMLISPIVFLVSLLSFFIILIIKKTLSLSSVICALIIFLSFIHKMFIDFFVSLDINFFNGGLYITDEFNIHLTYMSFIFVTILCSLSVFRHRENIKRLIKGEEPKTVFKKN